MEGSEDRTEIKSRKREDEMKDGWGQMEATDRVIRQRAGRVKQEK